MATASEPEDTGDDELVERCSLAHSITVQLEAAARANPNLDGRDRRNVSVVANYLALIAVGLAESEARGVLARVAGVLESKDATNAKALSLVTHAVTAHDKPKAAANLVALLTMKVDRRFAALWAGKSEEDHRAAPEVVKLLEDPGRKKAPAIMALLGKKAGVDGPAGDPAKKYDNSKRDLRNRKVGRK